MTRNQIVTLVIGVIVAFGAGTLFGKQVLSGMEQPNSSVSAIGETVAGDDAIAKIGNIVITERELAFAQGDLGQQFAQVPEELRKAAILNALIDIKALATKAAGTDIEMTDAFRARMSFLRSRALHNTYFQQNALEKISDEEVKGRYDKEIVSLPKSEEVHARHILVESEDEAKSIIADLDGGADFVTLAKEKSTGPSGPSGGDLGFFGKGQMVPEFEQAAFAMEDGQHTAEPVKTQFGWHVIKRESARLSQPPEFDGVKDQVRQMLAREKYLELIKKARDALKVEYFDKDLEEKVKELNKQS